MNHALGFYVYLNSFSLSKALLIYPECSASAVYRLDKEVSDHSYVLHCIFSLNFLIWVVLNCTWRTQLHHTQCILYILYISVCELWTAAMHEAVFKVCEHPHRCTGQICILPLLMPPKKTKNKVSFSRWSYYEFFNLYIFITVELN